MLPLDGTRGFGDGWTQMPHHLGPTFAISPEGEASFKIILSWNRLGVYEVRHQVVRHPKLKKITSPVKMSAIYGIWRRLDQNASPLGSNLRHFSPRGEASSGEASKIEKNHKSSKNVGHLRDLAKVGPECLTTWVQPSPFLPER